MPSHSHRLPAAAPPTAPPPRAPTAARATPPQAEPLSPAEQAFAWLAEPGATEQQRAQAVALVARHHYKPWVRAGQRRFGLSHQDAEDAAQTVLLKLLEIRGAPPVLPDAYLFRMFVNACTTVHRQHRKQAHWLWLDHPVEGDDAPQVELAAALQTSDPAQLVHWRRALALVVDVVLAQTTSLQDVAPLVAEEAYTDAEIATRLGITEASVGDRKYRLRKLLRTIFEDLFP